MFEAENCWLSEKNVAQVQPYIKHKIDLTKYDYEFVTDEATPSV